MRRSSKASEMRPETADKVVPALLPSHPRTEWTHVIHADGVYTVEDLRRVFGLKASSVRREVRLGRLRMSKRCGRHYCLGKWVLQWLESGELKRRCDQRDTNEGCNGSNQQSAEEARGSS